MSLEYLIGFKTDLIGCDTANTANAVVKRDASGNIVASAASLTALTLSIGLNLGAGVVKTTTCTLDATSIVWNMDATSAAFTATLPPASGNTGTVYVINKVDSSGNLPTIKGNASELIDGANTYTGLSAQYKSIVLWCNGTKWFIIAAF